MRFVNFLYILALFYIFLRVLRKLLRKTKMPKPSDYIGRDPYNIGWNILAGETLKPALMRKKKREELEIIRELDPEEEIRRIP